MENADYISMEFPFSAGAIVSTVNDLLKWNNALYSNLILSKEMLDKMTTPYLGNYGYGLFIDSNANHLKIGHSGGIPGFISQNDYYPKEKLHVIVLANFNANSPGIAKAIGAILFNQKLVATYKHIPKN